ncbi:MAG TPA: DUF6152 family protein [Bryobacteraceae bacterium]|nr:DUF6152 family protein [Bryobacteraceae bacterium]
MNKKFAMIFAGAALLVVAAPVWAHHSFAAEFDADRPVKLRGNITKMEWINPHAWIHIDVKDASGATASWMVECGSPNTLLRRGLTKASVASGQEIVVDGYQAKDGTNRANGRDVTLPDGRKLFLGTSDGEVGK